MLRLVNNSFDKPDRFEKTVAPIFKRCPYKTRSEISTKPDKFENPVGFNSTTSPYPVNRLIYYPYWPLIPLRNRLLQVALFLNEAVLLLP